ncbi:hypothetical protein MHYP_G00122590 [Metynnis hypsauchen]
MSPGHQHITKTTAAVLVIWIVHKCRFSENDCVLEAASYRRAMILPMSWIRPTSWNQSGEREHVHAGQCRVNAMLVPHPYLGAPCGCPQQFGRHGKSLGSRHQDRIHRLAGPDGQYSPSQSCENECNLPILHAGAEVRD